MQLYWARHSELGLKSLHKICVKIIEKALKMWKLEPLPLKISRHATVHSFLAWRLALKGV